MHMQLRVALLSQRCHLPSSCRHLPCSLPLAVDITLAVHLRSSDRRVNSGGWIFAGPDPTPLAGGGVSLPPGLTMDFSISIPSVDLSSQRARLNISHWNRTSFQVGRAQRIRALELRACMHALFVRAS